jgi:signal transduction histidine kinase
VDKELHIVLSNRAASLLFRMPADRLRGASITTLIVDADFAPWLCALDGGGPKVMETTLPRRGRARIPLTVRITALAMAGSTRHRWRGVSAAQRRDFKLLVLKDISETTVLEAQLVESEKQGAMGQLAAGILHEVRNPVGSLGSNLMFARNALGPSADPGVVQALEVSLEYLDQMRQLLGTLSAFPRRSAPHFELADVRDVVRRACTFIGKEAQRRGIHVVAASSPGPVTCDMDVRAIRQVLLNLLRNAMEAMPQGGRIEIGTSYRPPDRHGPATVLIEIADTGVGIPESDLRRVFRPLFSSKPRGAGLGLSYCRQVVEEHGGEIHLMSRGRDRGTVAFVSLPVRQTLSD